MYLWKFVHNYTSKKTQEYSEKLVGRQSWILNVTERMDEGVKFLKKLWPCIGGDIPIEW